MADETEKALDAHHDERTSSYLMARVNGVKIPRCWACDVRGHDEPYAMGNIPKRTFTVRVIGYYKKGQNGEGYLDLIDHARLVFEKLLTYANHLGLYSEQIGATGELLGNFPQAFTHLALISAAVNLDRELGS